MKFEVFNKKQMEIVNKSVEMSEEIVSGYYKMSSAQWLRNRYDVKTYIDLNEEEKVAEPFAQIVKYRGYKENRLLGSEVFDFYRICLQDPSIINLTESRQEILLPAFLLYILTHELIHIVRFGQFEQFFHVNGKERKIEEKMVHRITHKLLQNKKIQGLEAVFSYYAGAVL